MTSGRGLLGVIPKGRLRVWLWNLEDPKEETERKIQAAALHYKLTPHDIEGHLFVDSGRDQKLVIAETTRDGAKIVRPIVDSLIEQIKIRNIDVLIIDPFVSSHRVVENSNDDMDLVVKQWSAIAEFGNCAVELVHHSKKGELEKTVESSRGAIAITDACRSVQVLNRMTKDEAKKAGVRNHRLYFRVYADKANLAPPVETSHWFELQNVSLANGPHFWRYWWRRSRRRCAVAVAGCNGGCNGCRFCQSCRGYQGWQSGAKTLRHTIGWGWRLRRPLALMPPIRWNGQKLAPCWRRGSLRGTSSWSTGSTPNVRPKNLLRWLRTTNFCRTLLFRFSLPHHHLTPYRGGWWCGTLTPHLPHPCRTSGAASAASTPAKLCKDGCLLSV